MSDYDQNENLDNIVGSFLKCPKGKWEGVEVDTGPSGIRVTILMTTARHGIVCWDNGHAITRDLKRYVGCDPPPEKLPNGWDPYTVFQCLIDGELCTFAASSWGARKAFKKIVDNYRYLHKREFPTVTLGTKPRNDVNGNIDPVFTAIAWVPIGNFANMLPEAGERPQLKAPTQVQPIPPAAPPIAYDGGYAGHDPANDLPL